MHGRQVLTSRQMQPIASVGVLLFYRVSSLSSGHFGPSVLGERCAEIDLPPERLLMSLQDGSHPAMGNHEQSIEGPDSAGRLVEADPERVVDGLIRDLGLAETAAPSESRLTRFDAAADEPESPMTEFSKSEPTSSGSQAFDSDALEQLDDLTAKLTAVDGETEADSTDSLSAMRAELAVAQPDRSGSAGPGASAQSAAAARGRVR